MRSEKSGSIKYNSQRSAKLICNPQSIPINKKWEVIGLKIIIFNSGRFFAALNNTYKSAWTLALLVYIRRHGATIHIMLTNTIFIIKDSIQKKSCLKILISDSSFIFIISHVHTNLISAISTAKSCKDFSIFSIVVFEGLRLPVT